MRLLRWAFCFRCKAVRSFTRARVVLVEAEAEPGAADSGSDRGSVQETVQETDPETDLETDQAAAREADLVAAREAAGPFDPVPIVRTFPGFGFRHSKTSILQRLANWLEHGLASGRCDRDLQSSLRRCRICSGGLIQ